MPVRSRGQLLAGLGALLGLCTGLTTGCQLTPTNPDSVAQRPGPNNPSGPWFSFRHTREPAPKNAAGPNTDPSADQAAPDNSGPVAMMRPVAIRAVSDDSSPPGDVPMGVWHTANRPENSDAPAQPASTVVPLVSSSVTTADQVDSQPRPDTDFRQAPPANVVQPIPSQGVPRDRKATPAVFMGAPKPLIPPHAGAPVPKEFEKRSLSAYVVEPPDILLIQGSPAIGLRTQPLQGSHLVRPDGTVSLGIYGEAYVAGMTLEQIKVVVAEALIRYGIKIEKIDEKGNKVDATKAETLVKELQVDVVAYNSKYYYVIADGGGYGQQVFRLPVTGNETVLDAISQIGGLPSVACKKSIWVARATSHDSGHPKVMPVDWKGITQYGVAATNYQIYPGDRIFVQSDPLIRTDTIINKILTPLERIAGGILLGSSMRNSLGAKP